jgi:phosphoglycerate kinase
VSFGLPSLDALDLEGRTLFCRLDLNVPIRDGEIQSDARIQACLPTLRRLQAAGGRIAIAAHLGRPSGKPSPELRLEPVGLRLSELLQTELRMADDCIGDGVRGTLRELRPGQLMLLENLRFHPGEEKNDPQFARQLAAGFDSFVNDAFGAVHRAHASIVGVLPYVQQAAAGMLLCREVDALMNLRQSPKKPFVAIVGGAKVSDKIGVLEALMGRVDVLCIGGAMAYTFLQAQGIRVGTSRVEADATGIATQVIRRAQACGVQLVLPVDHLAGRAFAADTPLTHVNAPALPDGQMGLDIGPQTQALIAKSLVGAQTIFWNGPLGACELPACRSGTHAIARAVAASPAHSVVGGGDLVAALEQTGLTAHIGHVSTGGGASLELLQRGSLPGLDALQTFARTQARDASREQARMAARETDPDDPTQR